MLRRWRWRRFFWPAQMGRLSNMADITGIGASVFDTLYRLQSMPLEDTKQKAVSVTESGGGPCGTGLVAAAKLGASTAYIGFCSDDRAGAFLRADFHKYGVDTTHMTSIPDTTAFVSCIWLADENASRTCVFHRGTVPATQIDESAAAAIRDSQILMVDGNDLDAAVEGAKIARTAGTSVLYDAGGQYPHVERLLELTDILIPSEEFALGHTHADSVEHAAEKLWKMYSPKVVVITQGKQGGILYDGDRMLAYPAFPVEAVDTNGSGDVFHGAFAFALTQGWGYEQCCLFASATSAIKCLRVGAREGVPTYEAVIAFLKERGAGETYMWD